MLDNHQTCLITDCLAHRATTSLLHRYARTYGFEYDDLYQDAALLAIEIVLKRPYIKASNYLTRAIHLELIDKVEKWQRAIWPLSLDMAMGDDEETVGPWLIDKPRRTGDRKSARKARVLYEALAKLHPEEQAYFKRVYELHNYNGPEQVETTRRRDYIMRNGYAKLRRDRRLAAELEGVYA